ncbi:MAG: ABC transporter ATP-binding protein [Verrucomicrobiales bacterium]|nr:ABC transporter ATP-binding protein [Verrucomicrobiales bacterium]
MSRISRPAGGLDRDPSLRVRSRSTVEVVRRVVGYLRPYPALTAGTIACALGSLASALTYPQLTQFLIDDVIGARRPDLLGWAVLGLAIAFLARDALNSLRIRLNNTLEQNVIVDLRKDLYGRLQRLPVAWFDQRASGDLMTRVLEDVNAVERLLIDGTEQGTVAILSIAGVSILLFASNPVLASVAVLPVPMLAGGALWYSLTAHRRYRAQRQAGAAMGALLQDNLQGIRQIKSFGREVQEDGRFGAQADALRRGTLQVMKVWAVYNPAMTFFASMGTVLVLWVGGRQVLAGDLTLGGLVKFLGYLAMLYDPVGRLHTLNQMLSAARAAGERVLDVLDASPEAAVPRNPNPSRIRAKGAVDYEDVTAEYEGGRRALHGVSLRAAPGERVALVGPTGAGKSTLVNLLPRFYEATGGAIRVDGRDIRGIPLDELRAQIAVVSQEPFLFNGTLLENVRYGRESASVAEVEQAAKAANAHEFIRRLPEGYETRVGERGIRLSVGEKQRVSIARALLKDAPILILDEATASVDTATERMIQEALERLQSGRTSFIIAHRLGTVRTADQILVLNQGRIVERGRHGDLLASGGIYARLIHAQNSISDEVSGFGDRESPPCGNLPIRGDCV